jgi:outer membrane murein-binding lipoprotein Lpp
VKTALMTTIAALVAVTALAASASAATPSERRLARQVKTLQRQVTLLNRQVRTLRNQIRVVENVAAGGVVFGACNAAATADAFQGTWETIDQLAAGVAQPDRYPAPTAITDPLNSCQRLEIQRQPNTVPPTTNVFAALLNIFRGGAR